MRIIRLTLIFLVFCSHGCAYVRYGDFRAASFLKDIAVDEVAAGEISVKGYTSNAKADAALDLIKAVK